MKRFLVDAVWLALAFGLALAVGAVLHGCTRITITDRGPLRLVQTCSPDCHWETFDTDGGWPGGAVPVAAGEGVGP